MKEYFVSLNVKKVDSGCSYEQVYATIVDAENAKEALQKATLEVSSLENYSRSNLLSISTL